MAQPSTSQPIAYNSNKNESYLMKIFKNKVAVVTGGASGIGRAIAERCIQERMKVVLADVEQPALDQAEQELKAKGATILAVKTDVSNIEDMEALAEKTLAAFGAVHLLFNNAGVGTGSAAWESSLADWQWVIRVNLWGVIHGIHVFVPILLAQDTECYIVNTASIAGLLPYHPSAPYLVTKHAVVALTEHLYHSLAEKYTKVKVSVLCPGWVDTRIMDSERNRPIELQNKQVSKATNPELEAITQEMRQAANDGMSPRQVTDHVFKAIQSEQFYILTHPEFNPVIQKRMEDVLHSEIQPRREC
jgi:NAD(P)-dependent dehydrogenase (short-subunit alcohol dehydrogenase family)